MPKSLGTYFLNIWLGLGPSDHILSHGRHDHGCELTDLFTVINCSHVPTEKSKYISDCNEAFKHLNIARQKYFRKHHICFPAQVLLWPILFTNPCSWHFHQLGPLGPSWSSSRKVCLSVCPLPMPFFFKGGLVRTVPCLWTGADRASLSRGALKTGRCSELVCCFVVVTLKTVVMLPWTLKVLSDSLWLFSQGCLTAVSGLSMSCLWTVP